jgi:hypothetical protein
MNIDIEKIRETLKLLEAVDPLNALEVVSMISSELDKAAPVRYARQGPPIQMQDVLLACGELNERERVAVQWVLDKVNELPQQSDKAPGKVLTDGHYRIIAERMVEEHRKYGDKLRPGHWADVAARKVASHLADFGYLAPAAGPSDERPWMK